MKQIIIISPEEKLIRALHQVLSRVQSQGRATITRKYPSLEQLRKLLDTVLATTVIVDLSQAEQALQLIGELHANHPRVVVIAAHTVNSADLILAAVRAGAAEYIGPPFQAELLERALSKQAAGSSKPTARGHLVGFLPALGGSGGSTVAMHIAASIARESGKRALLVDFDFHSSALDLRLRLKPEFSMADAIRRCHCLDEVWSQLTCSWHGVDVLVAPPPECPLKPEELEESSAVFSSALRSYEWVITDLPAAVYTSCQDVLVRAEAVYIVCTPELASLHHARRKVQQLLSLGLQRAAVRLLVNRVDGKLSDAEVGNIVGVEVAWALRNDYAAVNGAYLKTRLVPEDSPLGRQFQGLARHIMGIPGGAQKPEVASNWKNALSHIRGQLASPSSKRKGESPGMAPKVLDVSPRPITA